MVESEIHDIPQLPQEENDILTTDFVEKEVYDAIVQMKKKFRVPMVSPRSSTNFLGDY
jgi:hypothetical protein